MQRIAMRISGTGEIKMIHNDSILPGTLKNIRRISTVEFDNATQKWIAKVRLGELVTPPTQNTTCFVTDTRKEAIEKEIELLTETLSTTNCKEEIPCLESI